MISFPVGMQFDVLPLLGFSFLVVVVVVVVSLYFNSVHIKDHS